MNTAQAELLRSMSVAMLLLARLAERRRVAVGQVAERTGLSLSRTERLLVRLRHAGLVRSFSGPTGGVCLMRPPHEITAWDVLRALDAPVADRRYAVIVLDDHARSVVEATLAALRGALEQIRLSDVCRVADSTRST